MFFFLGGGDTMDGVLKLFCDCQDLYMFKGSSDPFVEAADVTISWSV